MLGIMSWVGWVDKETPESVWKDMSINQTLREGRELYDWKYIPDPDTEVFRHGEARISYFTKPLEEVTNAT